MASNYTEKRSSKITISLPAKLLKTIDEIVAETNSNRSRVLADLVEQAERRRIEERMKQDYIAMAELAKKTADEWFPIVLENWPEWDGEEEFEEVEEETLVQ